MIDWCNGQVGCREHYHNIWYDFKTGGYLSRKEPNPCTDIQPMLAKLVCGRWMYVLKFAYSSAGTPDPLSATSMHSIPLSFSLTSIEVAPASTPFSTSSLTAIAKESTTYIHLGGGRVVGRRELRHKIGERENLQ